MCDCKVCVTGKKFTDALTRVTNEEDRVLFEAIYENMAEAATDADYYNLIVTGKWPQSEEIIVGHRPNLKALIHHLVELERNLDFYDPCDNATAYTMLRSKIMNAVDAFKSSGLDTRTSLQKVQL